MKEIRAVVLKPGWQYLDFDENICITSEAIRLHKRTPDADNWNCEELGIFIKEDIIRKPSNSKYFDIDYVVEEKLLTRELFDKIIKKVAYGLKNVYSGKSYCDELWNKIQEGKL